MSTHEPDGPQGWPPPNPFAPPHHGTAASTPPNAFAPPSPPRWGDGPQPGPSGPAGPTPAGEPTGPTPAGEPAASAGSRTEPLDVREVRAAPAGHDAPAQPDAERASRHEAPSDARAGAEHGHPTEHDTERLPVPQHPTPSDSLPANGAPPGSAPRDSVTAPWTGRVEAQQHAAPYGAAPSPSDPFRSDPFRSDPFRSGAGAQTATTPEPHAGGQWNPWSPSPGWPADPAVRGLDDAPDASEPLERRRRGRTLSVAWIVPLLVLSLLAGALGGVLADRAIGGARLADAGLPAQVPSDDPARPAASVAGIAATVLPSVVSIEVTAPQGRATGSGFVLRQDGYLMTNNHVIAAGAEPGADIRVVFADGSEEPATIVGRTSEYDLAVLKVERTGLAPLLLADSTEVVVGDAVVAVGAPLGLEGTVTTGIVSALNRPVQAGASDQTAFINAIQTDAAINPGNSGGPLVNGAGEVIGINSAIAQPPGGIGAAPGSIGLGFAIPSNQARRTASELIETGSATYPIIGVLLDENYTGEGVQVSTDTDGQQPVTSGGPADDAGIRPGDVIVAIDGRPVTQPDELIVAIRAKAPGDSTVLRVRTGEDERDVRVVLDQATSD